MSECTKLKIRRNCHSTFFVELEIDNEGAIIVFSGKPEKTETYAKELVRRWNAFEEGGIVSELVGKLQSIYNLEFPLLLGLAKLEDNPDSKVAHVKASMQEVQDILAKAKPE